MNFDDYKVKTPYPSRDDYQIEEVVTRNGKIVSRKFISDLEAYNKARMDYCQKENELYSQFKNDLFEELGISNHPKREKLYSLASEYGASEGLNSVFSYAEDLVDLIR